MKVSHLEVHGNKSQTLATAQNHEKYCSFQTIVSLAPQDLEGYDVAHRISAHPSNVEEAEIKNRKRYEVSSLFL